MLLNQWLRSARAWLHFHVRPGYAHDRAAPATGAATISLRDVPPPLNTVALPLATIDAEVSDYRTDGHLVRRARTQARHQDRGRGGRWTHLWPILRMNRFSISVSVNASPSLAASALSFSNMISNRVFSPVSIPAERIRSLWNVCVTAQSLAVEVTRRTRYNAALLLKFHPYFRLGQDWHHAKETPTDGSDSVRVFGNDSHVGCGSRS